MSSINPDFRPDIQGLRAIAVLLVVFAHAGFSWLIGGFVGVDVFFVISGYLITRLLVCEFQRNGSIKLSLFYLRRLRRLFPALLVMVLASVFLAWWLLPVIDAQKVVGSLPFAVTWTSNFFFAMRSMDYFDELEGKDLFLHTWSLGVEEQFYLIWPLLLLGLIAISGRLFNSSSWITLKYLLLAVTIFSLLVAIFWTQYSSIQAFYLVPFRAWQFGLGALVYLYEADYFLSSKVRFNTKLPILALFSERLSLFLAPIGIILILISAVFYDANMRYPGAWAIFPSLGAAMVIWGKHENSQGKQNLISHPILVWIGDRSYSMYLWHWPLMSLWKLIGLDQSNYGMVSPILLTLLFSILSYRFIELPFWKGRWKNYPARVFILGYTLGFLLSIAVGFHLQRIKIDEPAKIDALASIRLDFPIIYRMECDAWYHHARVEPCIFGSEDAKKTAVFIGDSIGAQWFSALVAIHPSPQWRLIVLTKSACPIVDQDYFYPRIGKVYDICAQWRNAVLDELDELRVERIIIGSASTYDFSRSEWIEGMRRILSRLYRAADQILIIAGTPTLSFDGPSCVARTIQSKGRLEEKDCVTQQVSNRIHEVVDYLREAAQGFENVHVFDSIDLVCPDGVCRAIALDGIPVFRDSQHLTDTFVRARAALIEENIERILQITEQ